MSRPPWNGLDIAVRPTITLWNEYHSPFEDNHLFINVQRDLVKSIVWAPDGCQAEVELARVLTRLTISPLQAATHQSQESRDDEIQPGDIVLLLGRYLLVAPVAGVPSNDLSDGEQMYEAMNWLEILGVDRRATNRRVRGRKAVESPLSGFV